MQETCCQHSHFVVAISLHCSSFKSVLFHCVLSSSCIYVQVSICCSISYGFTVVFVYKSLNYSTLYVNAVVCICLNYSTLYMQLYLYICQRCRTAVCFCVALCMYSSLSCSTLYEVTVVFVCQSLCCSTLYVHTVVCMSPSYSVLCSCSSIHT